jgi:hypothetical protein
MPEAAAPLPTPDVHPSEAAPATHATPACPLCASPMVVRLARRGPAAGSRYWGCTRDPECRGRREIEAGADAPLPGRRGSSIRAPSGPRARSAAADAGVERIARRPTEPDTTSLPSTGDDRATFHLRPDALAVAAVLAIAGVALLLIGPGLSGSTTALLGPVLVGAAAIVALGSLLVRPRRRGWQPRGDADRATSRALAPLTDEGWVVLEDRGMPASSEVLRHLLVGPGGVFIVESQALPGRLTIRGHDLYLNGRRRTAMVERARRQASAVVAALRASGHADSATALLCVHRAQLPVFGSGLDGVAIVDGPALLRRLRGEPPKLNADRIAVLTEALEQALPAVGGPGV